MRLRYTLPALADLEQILDYVAVRSPRGAARIQARIQATINLLLDYPLIGTPTQEPSVRRLTTTPYPYLIFYEVAGDELVIHAVRHAAVTVGHAR